MRSDFGKTGRGAVVVVRIGHIVGTNLDLVVIEVDVRSITEDSIAIQKLPLLIRATRA